MSSRPIGDIVTLLDLTPRDIQDGELFPLSHQKTWWLPEQERRLRPFTMGVHQFPLRGPASFGQRFSFDVGSVQSGDILFSTVLQLELGHWFDDTTLLRLESGRYVYPDNSDIWFYANSLSTVILEKAELEIDGVTIEEVDGDFLNVASLLFQDINNQFGFSVDGLGRRPFSSLAQTPGYRPFPTTSRKIFIPLPFFFQRIKLAEGLPLLACREGTVRVHITLRKFQDCVRLLKGSRVSCDETPLNKKIQIVDKTQEAQQFIDIQTSIAIPEFKSVQLITYSAHTLGTIRDKILYDPFEIMFRGCQTFTFDEPLKYQINKGSSDTVSVQLPIESNHPMEEIIWFIRRKDTKKNNEWTNYSSAIQTDWNPVYNPQQPLLHSALIQLNGIDLINAEEQWFRQHISLKHKGGAAAYFNYIYGYSFADSPGEHQPSGTANASRLQSIRLTLNVSAAYGLWEVKVFVLNLQWLRFQNGIANKIFQD